MVAMSKSVSAGSFDISFNLTGHFGVRSGGCSTLERLASDLTQAIQQRATPLFRFLRRFYCFPTRDLAAAKAVEQPFPSHAPYDMQYAAPVSKRRRARYRQTRCLNHLTNLYVGVMSWLAVGEPVKDMVGVLRVAQPLRPSTLSAVQSFRTELQRIGRDGASGFETLSGGRADIEELLQRLPRVGRLSAEASSSSLWADVPKGSALPLLAERSALPERGGTLQIVDWVEPSIRKKLLNPDAEMLADPVGQCPKPFNSSTRKQLLQYLGRCAKADMVIAYPSSMVPRGPGGEDLASGNFAVQKDELEDRTIRDRRPRNWAEKPWVQPKLSHPSAFEGIVLKAFQFLRLTVSDLPHFSIRVALQW